MKMMINALHEDNGDDDCSKDILQLARILNLKQMNNILVE